VFILETSKLRKLLSGPMVIAPGVFDALSARLVEQAGFPALYVSGYGVSASRLGSPDLGLLTMTEMADTVANMAGVVSTPIIADADTGYGNTLNIARVVYLYESAGASAIQIEDQQWPKRCGHVAGKKLVPVEEMIAKIRAAVAARTKDTLIIARTDAIAVEGFDAALKRGEQYLRAGAEVLFMEAPETEEQMSSIPRLLPAYHLINMVETTIGPRPSYTELQEMGYKLAIFPITPLLVATKSIMEALRTLKEDRSSLGLSDKMLTFKEFNNFIGMYDRLEVDRLFNEEAQKFVKPFEHK